MNKEKKIEAIDLFCGIGELALGKLPTLLAIKYKTIADAEQILGKLKNISSLFIGFQRYLYLKPVTIS